MSEKKVVDIEKELDEKIPRSAVSERDGGGGRRLSYLEGHYVIDRLNKVFGNLGWSHSIHDVRQVVNTTSKGEFPAYLVRVHLSIHSLGVGGIHDKYSEAYGYGADKSGQNAHELAIKEAVTDAIKVAAKNLGMSMGLALYSKDQENVDDDEPTESKEGRSEVKGPSPVVQAAPAPEGSPPIAKVDADKLREVIRGHVRAGIKKGTMTMEIVKEHLQSTHGVDNLDTLSEGPLKEVLEHVRGSA